MLGRLDLERVAALGALIGPRRHIAACWNWFRHCASSIPSRQFVPLKWDIVDMNTLAVAF